MNAWLVMIPLGSAFIGWTIARILVKMLFYPGKPKSFIGYLFQGSLLKQQQELSRKLAKLVSTELFSFNEIEERLLSSGNFKNIVAGVELHVDYFLTVKLKEKMPMVGMFVGERTLTQLKEIFMEELETLFPVIMKDYLSSFASDFDVEQIVHEKLASLPGEKSSAYITQLASKQLNFLTFMGAFIGFITGTLQFFLILFFYS